MKKMLSWVLTLALCLSLLPVTAWAEATTIASGYCGGEGDGTNLTWTLDSDGVLTISGTGAMADFKLDGDNDPPWDTNYLNIKTISIDMGITCIGEFAFNGLTNLTAATIPNSVTSIGRNAFAYCTSLTNVTIPKSVMQIGSSAFAGCSSLTNIIIPLGVTRIEDSVFAQCTSLSEVNIPDSVMSIGNSAFSGCTGLTDIQIPSSVKKMECFAFSECSSLTNIAIPSSVTNLGEKDASGNSNADGTDGAVFASCTSLTQITVDSANPAYKSIGGVLFNKDITELVCYPAGLSGEYEIPAGVTSIIYGAFWGASALTGITIPDSVSFVGYYAFASCSGLTDVNIPSSVTYIGLGAFQNCICLESINLPSDADNSAIYLRDSTFYNCTSLKNILIPCNFFKIGDEVFRGCSRLQTVTFSRSVRTVGDDLPGQFAFAECNSLSDIYFGGFEEDWGSYSAMQLIDSLDGVTIHYNCWDKQVHTIHDTVEEATLTTGRKTIHTCVGCGYSYADTETDPLPAIPTHTAIFKIGDTVIATVPFTEGDTALDEPNIPDKPNYIGAWDAYDLKNAKSDITVEGRYTPVDPDAVSDLGGDAEASYNNGVVTITLHASAPSQTIKVTSEKARPVDVVLVLDQSGSMKDTLGGRQSKRDALVDCANSFVQQLYQNAVATGANHRVALVGFACSDYNSTQAENRGGYVNTGLLATPSGAGKGFNSLTNADYAAALLPIKSGGSINANVITGINSIAAGGATAADVGLKMAKNIFSENPVGSERERIVIFITDGTPTRWTETKANIEQTAQNAIYIASTIKNAQGAKIYSVGVEATANPSTAFSSAASGVTTDWRGNFVSYDFNRFLHAVSSNYPAAASMSNLKDGDKGAGYYMAVNNTASLTKIFDNILYNTVYELKTFDKATLSYTLTNDFILTMEQELAMRAALTANGLTDADILVTRNNDGTTELTFRNVPVTQGVVNGTSGYHATVSFDVSAAKDTSGSVATGSASGVSYGDGDTQTSAGIANVTIPADRSVVVFKLNGKVYRMVDAAQGETITVPESELATWTIPDGATVNSAYVEFEATVSDTYNVHWMIDGADTVQSYHVGDAITPPNAGKAGFLFTGWMPAAPAVMPAHDITCTATFTEHTHRWVETYKTGTCDTGITTHYVCGVCDEVKSEFTAAHDHNYTAVLSDNGSAGTTVEKLVCTDCGYSKNQEVRFKITYTESYKTKVLDLNLYENEVSKSGATNEELEMRFFIGDDGGKTYRVTRIDADDSRTYYNVDSVDGYLVFKLDHFSIYVISEVDEATNEPTETVSYSESVQLIETAQPVVDDTPLADQTNNPSNPSTPSNPSNPSNPSKPRNTTPYYPWYQPASPSNTPSQSDNGKQQDTDEKQPETPWQNPYADVSENTYYFKAVAWASKLGVTLGTSETTFSPNKVCSRAEIVTFLWRAKGCPEPTLTTSPFDDLDESAYYYKAALWAYENGITNGASDTSFAPGADCTRAQVVTFLWRAEGKPTTSSALAFVDVNDSEYYAEAVAWASEQEITNGTGDGNFSPAMVCTRAQIVTFLYRDMAEEAVA